MGKRGECVRWVWGIGYRVGMGYRVGYILWATVEVCFVGNHCMLDHMFTF